jgi:[NiFe] hydrogenase diaphorase moiety large subunit
MAKKSSKKTAKKKASAKKSVSSSSSVKGIVRKYSADQGRLIDILLDVQDAMGCVSDKSIKEIAGLLKIPSVEVEQTVTFYHFFSKTPRGRYTIYLNNSVVAGFYGEKEVKKVFEAAAGVKFDGVSPDGLIGLYETACIGMNDQEPAAIINGKVFTNLTQDKAKAIVAAMKAGKSMEAIAGSVYGDGQNANPLMKSMVNNNLNKKGEVVFASYTLGDTVKQLVKMSSDEVIKTVKDSGIRGRGGAGFPTGMKWELAKKIAGDVKYIFCNADEGEPGTFKDRVILTELPGLVFEGLVTAGYATGAGMGILYLRNEYRYMKAYLESVLADMRKKRLLGKEIGGKKGFDYEIRIQFGAGAYVCGEESALIESAEGKRGEPRDRPPFPVEKGYQQKPTVVNNVETLASCARIVINGADWFKKFGTQDSKGTKVLSISGDCVKPGIYEVPFGLTIAEILEMTGAKDVQAVQVGGPSGTCIAENEFNRKVAFEDLATGGSMIIIGKKRDILKDVVLNFMEFFIDESCGSCVPCRAMTVMYKETLEKVINGKAVKQDLDNMTAWGAVMKKNRCGLGQTAMNPVVTTIKNFRPLYESKITITDESINAGFNLEEAVKDYDRAVKK